MKTSNNENSTSFVVNELGDPLHDLAANIEYVKRETEKKDADRRALMTRRRIEALHEERQLAKSLVDLEYD